MDQIRFEVPGENRYFIMSKPTSNVSFGIYSPEDGGWFTYWRTNTGDMIIPRGNLGIGTTAPTSKLSVNGDIKAKEVTVELAGWSDFVFEPTYQLYSLPQVESFILENKRLPGIPSESEVLENGIELGGMQAKLLQKIEELTLYLIEQNKELKYQQEQLDNQTELIKKLQKEIKLIQRSN